MAIRIFIDQGHNPGGVNAGAEGNGLYEQDVTYEVGRQLGQLLTATGNYEVLLSRNSPDEILGTSNASSLAARTNAANEWGADWFISIHANASTNQTATGSEGYVHDLHIGVQQKVCRIVQALGVYIFDRRDAEIFSEAAAQVLLCAPAHL